MATLGSPKKLSRRWLLGTILLTIVCLTTLTTCWVGKMLHSRSTTLVFADVYRTPNSRPSSITWRWLDNHTVFVNRPEMGTSGDFLTLTSRDNSNGFSTTTSPQPPWLHKYAITYASDRSWIAWRTATKQFDQVRLAQPDGTEIEGIAPPDGYNNNLVALPDGQHLASVPLTTALHSEVVVWDVNALSDPPLLLRHPALEVKVAAGKTLRPWILGFDANGVATAVDTGAHPEARNGRYNFRGGSMQLSFPNWGRSPIPPPDIHLLRFTPTEKGSDAAPAQRSVIHFPKEISQVYFTLSPDGKRIAWVTHEIIPRNPLTQVQHAFRLFVSTVPTPDTLRQRIWVSDADGTHLRQLESIPNGTRESLHPPVWLPNSREFSFLARRNLYKIVW